MTPRGAIDFQRRKDWKSDEEAFFREAGCQRSAAAVAGGKTIGEVCRRHAISEPMPYTWRRRYGGMGESEVKRLRELDNENARLKRLLAERDVELDAMSL